MDNTSTGFFLKVFVYFCALAVNCSYMLFLGSFLPAMNGVGVLSVDAGNVSI